MDNRISNLELQMEKLAVIQEQQIKSQEITTKNIDALRVDIKQLLVRNGDIRVLESECTACHKRLNRLEKIWITTAGTGILLLIGVISDFFKHT